MKVTMWDMTLIVCIVQIWGLPDCKNRTNILILLNDLYYIYIYTGFHQLT